MNNKEGLYSSLVRNFQPDAPLFEVGEHLPQSERDFHFAMHCNGYFLSESGQWIFNPNVSETFNEEFKGQSISFFGPHAVRRGPFLFAVTAPFFSGKDVGWHLLKRSFEQQEVIEAIGRYRQDDEDLSARIAFLFGGIVRHLATHGTNSNQVEMDKIANTVKFAAIMTRLGEERSADAIASAVSMYVISGGSLENNRGFAGDIYHMADAIREDPITPLETEDLGLSQVARLKAFLGKVGETVPQPLPDISQYKAAFENFPTVGAEFHFSLEAPKQYKDFGKDWHY